MKRTDAQPCSSVTATGSTQLRRSVVMSLGSASGWKTSGPAGSGTTGRLALLVDEATGVQFLVDTGAVFSVLPYTSSELPTGLKITTADKSPIPCWGWVQWRILAGGTYFDWKFLCAKVAFPILGADFLENFDLWVDLRQARLVQQRGALICLCCPLSSGGGSLQQVWDPPGSSSGRGAFLRRGSGAAVGGAGSGFITSPRATCGWCAAGHLRLGRGGNYHCNIILV